MGNIDGFGCSPSPAQIDLCALTILYTSGDIIVALNQLSDEIALDLADGMKIRL